MESLISADNIFALCLVLFSSALLGLIWDKSKLASWCSGLLFVISIPALLANFDVIPAEAPVYEAIGDFAVPVLVALLLFNADLIKIFRESGVVLIAFGLAVIGTTAGSIVALSLYDLGPDTADLAGVFTATYIGGVPNFIGVADATGVADGGQLPVLIAVDNAAGVIFFLLIGLMVSSTLLQKLFGFNQDNIEPRFTESKSTDDEPTPLLPIRVLGAFTIALVMTVISKEISKVFGVEDFYLLVLTVVAVVTATLLSEPLSYFKGAFESGYVLCYIYIATFAPEVDFVSAVRDGPMLFVFALTVLLFHFVFVFGVGRLFKLRLSELLVASVAAVWGTGATAALAASQKWTGLITPAVLVSVLGVAVGTFLGITIANIF